MLLQIGKHSTESSERADAHSPQFKSDLSTCWLASRSTDMPPLGCSTAIARQPSLKMPPFSQAILSRVSPRTCFPFGYVWAERKKEKQQEGQEERGEDGGVRAGEGTTGFSTKAAEIPASMALHSSSRRRGGWGSSSSSGKIYRYRASTQMLQWPARRL